MTPKRSSFSFCQMFVLKVFFFLPPFLIFLVTNSLAQPKTVTLLYTNDVESVYEPVAAFWRQDIAYIGGLPYLAGLINQVRQEEPQSFLFDAGDIFTGALSAVTAGVLPFDLYNSMGYDAMALGNHEFEYGWEKLAYVKQRAHFPVLNCNIFYQNTNINFSQAYAIVEKGNVKVGLIGVMGLEAFKNTINPAHRAGLEIRDPYPIVQGIVDNIREEVDLVVLLTHQNKSAPMQTDKEADPEVQRGFDEDYALAGSIKGVDVIIGGHSDNGLWQPVKHPQTGTLICLTFGQGKYLGYLNLTLNEETGVILNEGKLMPVEPARLTPDARVWQLIQQAREKHPQLTEVIGNTEKPAWRKYYRESSLGNLLADILREASKADIAIMNSGSIRADLNAGEITMEEMINIYPFIGKFHVVKITGQALQELLEYSYQLTYGLVQVSGLTTRYNSQLPAGRRLVEARVNNQLVDPARKYTVACSAFLANGGDGFGMLQQGHVISKSSNRMIDYFINYIRANNQLAVPPTGRQIDLARKKDN